MSTQSPQVVTKAKYRILVVEDEVLIADEIAEQIEQFGYEALGPVATGEEALVVAQAEKPDLILFDIRLAGPLDGIDAAKEIRSTHQIPVVFVTAHSDETTLARAQVTDPFGYVLKPFSELELKTAIRLAILKSNTVLRSELKEVESAPEPVFQKEGGEELYQILQQVPYVASLEKSILKDIAFSSRREKVKAGNVLVLEGDRNVPGFLVLSGRVSMVKSSDSGRDLTVELLPAGDPFGLGVALAWDPYPVTVKAQITSEILWIPRFKIFEIFDAHPSFSKAIMKDIFDRLRSAHNLERGLAHDRTDVRVATALLALAPRFQKFESHSPNNCIPMTREQLGECIGCATETVVRVTKDWERRGIVDLSKRGKITVLNTDELEEAAGINF